MNSLAELARLIENLIRLGTVAEVQVEPPRVRVKTGNVTTAWRPWFALRAGEDREWDPPTVGEQVILFSPSGNLAQGVTRPTCSTSAASCSASPMPTSK